MALGTSPAAVIRLVIARVWMLVAGGLVLGLMVSWWATQFTSALLFELEPRDVPTMAGAALLLTAVAGLSAWLPARIDPASVLRES